MHQWFRESKIQVVIYATTEGPRGKFKLLCKGKRGEKMASSREKSLATIQEAQITVTEVLGRLSFDTATFRGWNKVQATGRHFSQYKCRKNDLNWQEVLLTLGRTRKFIPSLRSRRLELVGTRKNGRARRRHAPCVSPSRAPVLSFACYFQAPPSRAPVLSFACYFQAPATQANSYPHRGTKGVGGGVWMEPNLEFLICCSISKRFYLQ